MEGHLVGAHGGEKQGIHMVLFSLHGTEEESEERPQQMVC